MSKTNEILKERLTEDNYNKLTALNNPKMHEFIVDALELTGAESVYVCTDSEADRTYIRNLALKLGEETALATKGHTYHFVRFYQVQDNLRSLH